jgi:hypothetical protein
MIGYEKPKSQLTFTPEVLTCCALYNHCDYYYLTLLFIYTQDSQKRTGHPSEPGSSLGFFLGSGLSKEFFLDTVPLHLPCLLFKVLGWVSVQHFVTSVDVKMALKIHLID